MGYKFESIDVEEYQIGRYSYKLIIHRLTTTPHYLRVNCVKVIKKQQVHPWRGPKEVKTETLKCDWTRGIGLGLKRE